MRIRNYHCFSLCAVLVFCFLLIQNQSGAQVSAYSFNAAPGTFTEITVAGGAVQPAMTGGSPDDGYYENIPVGFSFDLDGTTYNTLSASTNGFCVLGSNIQYSAFYNNLTSGTPRPILAPLWDDLKQDITGAFQYQTDGTAPNRVFTAQWTNFDWSWTTSVPAVSFQLKLYESANTIEFVYRQESAAPSGSSLGASIGITSIAAGAGNFLSLTNSSANPGLSAVSETTTISTCPATGQTYTFNPPVATQPPYCAIFTAPANGGTGVSITPALSWANGGGVPSGYLLYLGTDGGGVTTPTNIANGINAASPYTPAMPLNYSTTYYWQIVPYNSYGSATGCPVWSFTTRPDPTAPLPFYEDFDACSWTLPLDWVSDMTVGYGNGVNGSQALTENLWNYHTSCFAVTPPIGPLTTNSALEFEYLITDWGYPSGATVLGPNDKITISISADYGLTYTPVYTIDQSNHVPSTQFAMVHAGLSNYTGMVVMVRFDGTWGSGDYNIDIDNVTVFDNSVPPSCTNPIEPADGAVNVPVIAQLVWQNTPGATGYRLYLGTDGGGITTPVNMVNGAVVTSPYTLPAPLAYSTNYYWQIVPFNSFGSPVNCAIWGFTSRPDPTLPLPWSENFNASYNLPLDWVSDMYVSSFHGVGGTNGLYQNLWSYMNTCEAVTPPVGPLTSNSSLEFEYRIINYSGYPSTATSLGPNDNINIQVSTDYGLTYTNLYTINQSNHIPSTQFVLISKALSAYTGQVVMLRLSGVWGSGDYYIDFDNFMIFDNSVPPSCTSPLLPLAGGVNVPVTTQLAWQNAPGAAGYRLYFGTDGGGINTPTNIVSGAVVASPYNLTAPLAYSTTYYWQVIPFNSFGNPAGCPIWSFTSRPDPTIPIPWTEDFNAGYNLPLDWISDMLVSPMHGVNGTNGLYQNLWSYENTCEALTPPIGPLTANSTLEFEYRIVNYGGYPYTATNLGANDKINISISSDYGLTYTTLMSIDQSNHVPSTQFALLSNALGAYTGQVVMIKINGLWASGDYYIDFDNFTIYDNSVPPSCVNILNPANGAGIVPIYTGLAWSGTSGASGYRLYFGTDGGGVVTPTNLVNGAQVTSPYQPVPQLTYSTTYYWQVVPFNSFGSPANCPINSFTTMADPSIYTFPFTEGFEISVPPPGWIQEVVGQGQSSYNLPEWTQESAGTFPQCLPHEGSYMATFNSWFCTSGAEARLSTPPVDFTTVASPSMTFWMYHDPGFSYASAEGVQVQVSLDGIIWTNAGAFIPRVGPLAEWQQHNIDLTAYAGQVVYIGFLGHSAYGNNCHIDEVTIGDNVYNAVAGPSVNICDGSSAQLNATASGGVPPYSFQWSPATGLSDPNIANPQASPSSTTVYTLLVTDFRGAMANDHLVVGVIPLPTVFLAPLQPVALNWPAFPLTGGQPQGGQYSGPGVSNGMFYPAMAGVGLHTISYTWTGQDNCPNSAQQDIEVTPLTGLTDNSGGIAVNIFPNPTQGAIDLTINGVNEKLELKVVNLQGQEVWNASIDGQSGKYSGHLDLSGQPRGIYYLQVTGEKMTGVHKMVLQ